jgi:hypothetical protein
MKVIQSKRAVSSEAVKIAAAMLLALAIFSILLQFTAVTEESDSSVSGIGKDILNFSQKTSFEIINYGKSTD